MDVEHLKLALEELRQRGEVVIGFTLTPSAYSRFKESVRAWFISHGNSPNGVAIADEIKIEGVTITCAKFQDHPVVRWDKEEDMRYYLDVQRLESCLEL